MIKFQNERERDQVLHDLTVNMNEEFRATLQYICHRISALPQDPAMAESFKSAALDEMSHILFFSDLISRCGGVPEFDTWDIDKSTDIPTMLTSDIALEIEAKERYIQQVERWKEYPELLNIIESVLVDEQDHEEEFRRYLESIR